MRKNMYLVGMVSLLLLGGCVGIGGNEVKTDSMQTINNNQPTMINSGLSVKQLTIKSGNSQHQMQVEIASTDQQRKIGLMNRLNLDQDRGMLFIFDKQGVLYFWMKDTLFPLDMVFIDQKGIIQDIVRNAQPCTGSDADCLKISPRKPVRYVLEINAGEADRLGLKLGDTVSWN